MIFLTNTLNLKILFLNSIQTFMTYCPPNSTSPNVRTAVDYPITRQRRYNSREASQIGCYESLWDFCGTLLQLVECCCNPFGVGCNVSY